MHLHHPLIQLAECIIKISMVYAPSFSQLWSIENTNIPRRKQGKGSMFNSAKKNCIANQKHDHFPKF